MIILICFGTLCLIVVPSFMLFKKRNSLLSPISTSNIIPNNKDSIINIIILGDSWAEIAKEYMMPQILDSILNTNNITGSTVAKGEHGATSRDIYFNICSEHETLNPLPDIAIISCGINDSHGQYGSKFYTHHTLLLLQKLIELGITPILIELPNYDISSQYKYYSFYKQFAYRLLSLFTDCSLEINNIERYRNELYATLNEHDIKKDVNIISIDSFSNLYYGDYMHLNASGYYHLAECIANIIIHSSPYSPYIKYHQ